MGKVFVHLDCVTDNRFLPQYYAEAGFLARGEVEARYPDPFGTMRLQLWESRVQDCLQEPAGAGNGYRPLVFPGVLSVTPRGGQTGLSLVVAEGQGNVRHDADETTEDDRTRRARDRARIPRQFPRPGCGMH